MNALTSFVKRNRLVSFVILAYALSWWPVLLVVSGVWEIPVAAFGPFLAALVVLGLTEGRTGVKSLLGRMVRWRVGVQWYLIALGLPILMNGLASYLVVLMGAPAPSAEQLAGWPGIFTGFLIVLLIPGLGGAWEEPGWRGFAVHRLEERWSRLWALVPLWAIIVFWHLPLFLTGDGGWPDVVNMIGGVILYTWLYHRSGNSVLLVMIIHAMNNAVSGEFTSTLFDGVYATQLAWMKALVWGLVAAIVIVAYWRWWTEKSPATVEEPEPALETG